MRVKGSLGDLTQRQMGARSCKGLSLVSSLRGISGYHNESEKGIHKAQEVVTAR